MNTTLATQAVVFDLFHTLVTPEAVHANAYLRTSRMAAALRLDAADFERWWVDSKDERNRARSPTVADRIAQYCTRIGRPRTVGDVEAALFAADRYHDVAIQFPPSEVLGALAQLRKRKLQVGILSNADEHEVRAWPDSPIARLVDAASISVDSGLVKPEPAAYRGILAALGGVSPSATMYVGDGESGELVAAKQLGFQPVVFMRGFVTGNGFQTPANIQQLSTQADHTIDRIDETLQYLR
ncbi:MAG: HAD family hydrolase [Euryarchaeota archaeon]|nr:HAD family hydrolase [Euryarchaeota archaeon]MDE1836719.1 HAD family hydrolase [Euryarchaeota archaeon]MDE1881748.1 HAD family hydrolase [Euryarchaeota archaeon]MDE2044703.1 HAD family hydrolase [Thermoplasmata archaeon]